MNKLTLHLFSLFFLLIAFSMQVQAQVGINILTPDSSAILHLESTDRGLLFPRLDSLQRNSIVSPKAGLQIYNTNDSLMQYYNGECWLSAWQRNCADCAFSFLANRTTGRIDRTVSSSDTTQMNIRQIAGTSQSIAVYIIPNLPDGITASLDTMTVQDSGTITLTVTASLFAPAGTYPVIVQALCGNTISNQVFVVTVDPCIEIDITSPMSNVNLQAGANIPNAQPVCVVLRIASGVTLTNTGNNPVLNIGNLHPASRVGILNEGDLLARGGNGGVASGVGGVIATGENGTDAINITTYTELINRGKIYAGGGGGGAVGFAASLPIPGISFSLGIGAGGGGGARDGIGGNLSGGLSYYARGINGTGGVAGIGGAGGALITPIGFAVSVVDITLTPRVYGGNGGDYGMDGTSGTLSVNVLARINVPLVGGVTVLNQAFPDPPLSNFPAAGLGGHAVKKNGNTLVGINNGHYINSNIRGRVQ